MTDSDIRRVRESTDLRKLVSEAGVKLSRNNRAKCPFCQSKGLRNFAVKDDKWFCHGCRAGGDAIAFVMRLDGCDFKSAILSLAAELGVTISDAPETAEQRRQRERDKREREICDWWMRQEWIKARRGLDRAMEAWTRGNRFAEDCAEIHGRRLRWIEANRRSAEGLAEFRAARVTDRQYREWLCGDLRRYAAMWEFAELIFSTCG